MKNNTTILFHTFSIVIAVHLLIQQTLASVKLYSVNITFYSSMPVVLCFAYKSTLACCLVLSISIYKLADLLTRGISEMLMCGMCCCQHL